MGKYWLLKENSNHLIAIFENKIYTGSTKDYFESNLVNDLENEIIPKGIFSIPFTYIKSIENPKNENIITIYFGNDSSEILIINEKNIRNEIFYYLKNSLPTFDYIKKTPSLYKYAKPQVFAILITFGLFLWIMNLSIEISKGSEYEIVGKGIGSVMLYLAKLGKIKIIIGYLCILSIAVVSLIKKNNKRSLIEYLIRSKN